MKNKKYKKIITFLMIISLLSLYGASIAKPGNVLAVDSVTDASDTISDSDAEVSANHVFRFTTGTTTDTGGYWRIDFEPDDLTTANNFDMTNASTSCPSGDEANWVASTSAAATDKKIDCVRIGADLTGSTTLWNVLEIRNPAVGEEGPKYIDIFIYDSSNTLKERIRVAVMVIQDVLVTARVDSTLNFTINGTSTNAYCASTTVQALGTSTATTLPFGTLTVDATSTLCQDLHVTTNANDGFTVTVWQDQELTNDSNSNINSFDNSPDNTGSTTPEAWTSPTNVLDQYHTYGHMGITSNDTDLSSGTGYNDFWNSGTPLYAGLNGSSTMPVFHHNGPSDGSTQDKGVATVAYTIEVGSLQEAGDYESTLTYICTPIF